MPESTERLILVTCDSHAGPQSMAGYAPYVPEKHKAAFDDYVHRIDAFDAAQAAAGEAALMASGSRRGGAIVHDENRGLWDMSVRAQHLEADGVAGELIFTQGSVPFAPYPAIANAYGRMDWAPSEAQRDVGAEIYNRWLADLCSADPDLHYGIAAIPIRNLDAAVAEVARAKRAGLNGGIQLPAVNDELRYNERAYDRLWAACQDHAMVVNLHGGAGMFYGQGPDAMALILAEVDFFSRRALWFLIFSGVLERFPKLHVAVTEQRAHWVPPMLHELDSIYRTPRCAELRKQLPRLPSEYFASHCFIGASFMSRAECGLRHAIGTDRLMWGSDYPHLEGAWPWLRESLRSTFEGVEEQELRQMLGGNAIRCYGFDADKLRRKAAQIGPTFDEVLAMPIGSPPQGPQAEMSWAFRSDIWH